MRLPDDPNGYAVLDGTLHTRYADHAEGARRTRTQVGALALAAKRLCRDCYPPKPQTRRKR